MNKVYVFGKIVYKSKLKYIISPKLKVYMELIIQEASEYEFSCVVNEDVLKKIKDGIRKVDEATYVYIMGEARLENNMLYIIVKDVYIFS